MMLNEEKARLCRLFADILEYPGTMLAATAGECARDLDDRDAAAAMRDFAGFTAAQTRGALEELYTQTFDVTPANALYIGHHLFGEDQKRSVFMTRLRNAYHADGFSGGTELPDHLSVVLRFLGETSDEEFAVPLVREGVLPVLKKLNRSFPKDKPGYGHVLDALERFLGRMDRQLARTGGSRNG